MSVFDHLHNLGFTVTIVPLVDCEHRFYIRVSKNGIDQATIRSSHPLTALNNVAKEFILYKNV